MAVKILAGGTFTLVSDVDADFIQYTWFITKSGYVARNTPRPNRRQMRLHRAVLARALGRQLSRDERVDHVNGNRLDNRRENLRIATAAQNNYNRTVVTGASGYKGVFHNTNCRTFQAAITVGGKKIYLGSFHDPRDAARAYDAAAQHVAGPFARVNFK